MAKLKATSQGAEVGTDDGGGEAATSQTTPIVLVLPELSAPLDLKSHFNTLLLQIMGSPARNIASDARIFNFPIPSTVDITIIVP